ncbi:hypothetical protein [Rhizobium sp. BK176]|uniref:hypothetical protein n=1 Tax=Rhizobium sp. BK176 TaxID=2587071 RepID=UPI002168F46E|nr:hypothetical protein [Rhizobium sp. BK176]MCS4089650.1 hypothetical protein [Rhizobium sp. BK176]
MNLHEILQLDSEFRDDLETVGERLFRLNPPRLIAGNCLLVSVNLAELVQLAIQVEFDQYAETEIYVEVGNLGIPTTDGGTTKWLWDDEDILDLSADLIALSHQQDQGYHVWLSFAGSLIDPTVLFTLTLGEDDEHSARPLYIDNNGVTYPPGRDLRYNGLRRFSVSDLQQFPSLFLL